eukprot:14924404-Heterocapsa_arctica.AAC.1
MIKRNPVNKHLEMLAEIAMKKDDCEKFYDQLRECLKLNHNKDYVNYINMVKKYLEMLAETANNKDNYKKFEQLR